MSALNDLLVEHSKLLEDNPYCYFELVYTPPSCWRTCIWSNHLAGKMHLRTIAKGKGPTPDQACEDALRYMRKNSK